MKFRTLTITLLVMEMLAMTANMATAEDKRIIMHNTKITVLETRASIAWLIEPAEGHDQEMPERLYQLLNTGNHVDSAE